MLGEEFVGRGVDEVELGIGVDFFGTRTRPAGREAANGKAVWEIDVGLGLD
jgi:hypothetical protein